MSEVYMSNEHNRGTASREEFEERVKQLELSKADLTDLYQTMATIRHFEYMADKLYAAGKVHGTMHLSAGQEAVAAGIALAVQPDDYLINHHRGHGHFIAKGADINMMMAEFLGKDTGYNHGRGVSMHIAGLPRFKSLALAQAPPEALDGIAARLADSSRR